MCSSDLAGESTRDVEAGVVGIAMRRASLFGRAPVVHDLTVAFTVFGFLDREPSAELVQRRGELFSGVSNPHHQPALRELVSSVPEETLRLPHRNVVDQHRQNWRLLLA